MKVNFCLSYSIDVNAIVGLLSLTDWKMILDFDKSKPYYKAMHISFPLSLMEYFIV